MMINNEFSAPEARQAISILSGISTLSVEIKTLARRFDALTPIDASRKYIALSIIDLLDRLANLELLERAHLDSDIGEKCSQAILIGLDEARDCIAASAIALVLTRVEEARDRALAIVSGRGECTLGLSRHLMQIVDSVDMVVHALLGRTASATVDISAIEEARQAVHQLDAIERKMLTLSEFAS